MSMPVDCYHPHPPSPFIIITQPESWQSFYRSSEAERLRHCPCMWSPCSRLYIKVDVVINTNVHHGSRSYNLSIAARRVTTRPLRRRINIDEPTSKDKLHSKRLNWSWGCVSDALVDSSVLGAYVVNDQWTVRQRHVPTYECNGLLLARLHIV